MPERTIPNTTPGKLIAVEGLDGSGKSTQVYLLKRWLELSGYKVFFTEWNSSEIVRSVECRLQNGSLHLRAVSRKSCRLEALGVTANAAMFRDHFGVDVQLTIDREE